jgi:2-polyprenyl-6-methoxyphenol hydroxylase-like FAD-dependent oxidoreductase
MKGKPAFFDRSNGEMATRERVWDVLVVGGGIAGMYAAYTLKTARPDLRVCVLERARRFGGRICTTTFRGVDVTVGAGAGRLEKDRLLAKLIADLGLPKPETTTFAVAYAFRPIDVLRALAKVRRAAARSPDDATFRDCGLDALGEGGYAAFVRTVGFSDFEAMGAWDALETYGFEDTHASGYSTMRVPWRGMIDALKSRLVALGVALRSSCDVATARCVGPGWVVRTSDGCTHRSNSVVLATDVDALKRVAPRAAVPPVHGQAFLRLFVETEHPLVGRYTVVGNALQKMVPVNDRVCMAAYCDNANAEIVNAASNREVSRLIGDALGVPPPCILAMKKVFWRVGTHFREPGAPRVVDVHPSPGLWLVGEAVAQHNGWTEGALESVERVMPALRKSLQLGLDAKKS